MTAIRTFVAVKIDDSLHAALEKLIGKLAASKANVKWVAPQNVHVTMKFLGNVEEDRLPDIFAACEQAASGLKPIDLAIRTVGGFPNMKRPNVVWVGIEQGCEPLRQLQQRVEAELERVGFKREHRKFKAHLTIGRVRNQNGISKLRRLIDEERNAVIGSMRAEQISVMKSQLLPSGPIYEELRAVPL